MNNKIQKKLEQAEQHVNAGAYPEAVKTLNKIIAKAPANVSALLMLGKAYGFQELHADAERAFAHAARLTPRLLEAHAYLGLAFSKQGKNEQAINSFKESLKIQPRLIMALANLVTLLHNLDRPHEAMTYLDRWLEIEPLSCPAHFNAGVLNQALQKFQEARDHYQKVLELGGHGVSAYSTHLNLGVVFYCLRDYESAIEHSRQALRYKPNCAVCYVNIGDSLKDQGKYEEAIASFEQALKYDPAFEGAHSNILFCMNYSDAYDARMIFNRHIEWAERHAGRYLLSVPHNNDRNPQRILRIGYVSADFREHSVGFFMEGVLQHHSASHCEIFCYSNSGKEDSVTARMRTYVHNWREISKMSDDAVAAMIREDGIDILVDLSGHTFGNRLMVFARKPAPVQVTWLGYCNTTGLSNMDYLLADSVVIPPETTQLFSERVKYLPGSYLCYVAPEYAPDVAAPPCIAAGHITFGCFNNLSKVTEHMLNLWVEILLRMPEARFVLKSKQLADAVVQQRYRDWFGSHGIASGRVMLEGRVLDHIGLLGLYGGVDIALDTHPYSGVTTTCEALWMGVPVVTLTGEKFFSRNSAALVSNVGLSDLIASTPRQYIEIAVALANDHARLAQLRSVQRKRFRESPSGNAPLFVRNLEDAYREMWEVWCGKSS